MTHICISKLNTVGSDNGLSPGRHQAIILTNVLSFVNEIISGRSPDILKKYSILKNNRYDMRRIAELNVPPRRTQICDKAVRVFGASQWNKLEKYMLQHRFKNVLRNSCWNIICLDTMYEFCWMQIHFFLYVIYLLHHVLFMRFDIISL